MESLLEVKDLQKNYGDFAAVKGITFDIKEGEILLGEGLPRHPLAPDTRTGVRPWQVCVAPFKGRPSRSLTGGLPFPAEITRWSALSPFRSRVTPGQTRSVSEIQPPRSFLSYLRNFCNHLCCPANHTG